MTRLYRKNQLAFSLAWAGLYVVLFSAADSLSASLGTAKLVTAPLCLAMTALLALWIGKNGLGEIYGLSRVRLDCRRYLYFLPLVLIASTNLWGGFTMRFSPLETGLYVVSMLCVGFLEEVIFRGLLFKALWADAENVGWAVLLSSLTFGMGHIVNLLNGAQLLPTLLQICYATAIDFLFTVLFLRPGTLLPCILTHSAVNSLSAFAVERTGALDIAAAAVLTAVSLAYALWILRRSARP